MFSSSPTSGPENGNDCAKNAGRLERYRKRRRFLSTMREIQISDSHGRERLA
jgi:hypothetical protein